MPQPTQPQHNATDARGDNLMTLNETARYLGQPVEEVFRWIMCGRLPAVWVGPRPYVDPTVAPEHARSMCARGVHTRCADTDLTCRCSCHTLGPRRVGDPRG